MANISERKDKNGNVISYRIRVAQGYDANGKKLKPLEMTWKPSPDMTPRQIEKELNRVAVEFEERCKVGLAGNGRQKFSEYSEYVLDLKERNGELRLNTSARYRDLIVRVNKGIGHIKLCELRPQHLNALYAQLGKEGLRKGAGKATLKPDVNLKDKIHALGYTSIEAFAKASAGVSATTFKAAAKGSTINLDCAQKIADALKESVDTLFDVTRDMRPLSSKTIREHHVLIHMILAQAEKELLVPYNAADKATPPKVETHEVNYFQQHEVDAILQAAESEPIKWKLMLHLMLVTGGRRGEMLGLTWDDVDFDYNRIHINKCVYYNRKLGIYIDKPKTKNSVRYISLPAESMQLLREYRDTYYNPLKEAVGDQWKGEGFIFVSDSGDKSGHVMHPDSVTGYCDDFATKHGLRHINPHAFRHTNVSLLYFNGMDSISISKHIGHASVSTTTNIYGHVIAEAESRSAQVMGDIILSCRKPGITVQNKPEDENIKEESAV